jgi:hypothetical protein
MMSAGVHVCSMSRQCASPNDTARSLAPFTEGVFAVFAAGDMQVERTYLTVSLMNSLHWERHWPASRSQVTSLDIRTLADMANLRNGQAHVVCMHEKRHINGPTPRLMPFMQNNCCMRIRYAHCGRNQATLTPEEVVLDPSIVAAAACIRTAPMVLDSTV